MIELDLEQPRLATLTLPLLETLSPLNVVCWRERAESHQDAGQPHHQFTDCDREPAASPSPSLVLLLVSCASSLQSSCVSGQATSSVLCLISASEPRGLGGSTALLSVWERPWPFPA